jgi:checkpoint serine/threonine-protein kinase
MLDVPSIFNAEGVEYSFEEVRAKKLGLLDKKWPKPEPWEYHYPSAPAPTRAPVSSVKFAENTVSHAARADTSEASFASTVSPPVSPGQQQLVNFDGPGFGPSGASRTQVYKRMGNMGAGFGMAVPEPTVTINTKESLDDVYGMMNSPEKTMHSGAKPGSKYAPVKRLDQGGSSLSRTPLFGRTLSSENAAPIPTFQPFTDENEGAGGGFVPFVDENANPARPKTPAAGPSRPALTPCKSFVISEDTNSALSSFFVQDTCR